MRYGRMKIALSDLALLNRIWQEDQDRRIQNGPPKRLRGLRGWKHWPASKGRYLTASEITTVASQLETPQSPNTARDRKGRRK
jgi:hypothetical protein